MAENESPRVGRPPKIDADGKPTRERLLAAAAAACVEEGFEGATLPKIAARADVSTPAIYNHFSGKSELLVEACRWALEGMAPHEPAHTRDPRSIARRYLRPRFAQARRLQLELHLASLRHPDVADLLAKWHGDHAAQWTDSGRASLPTVKTLYLLLLGLAQVDAISSLDVKHSELEAEVYRMVDALFADRDDRAD